MNQYSYRIGNYVSHEDYSTDVFVIKSINFYDEHNDYMVDTTGGKNGTWINPIENIKPIKITQEFLEKNKFTIINHPQQIGYKLKDLYIYEHGSFVGEVEVAHVEYVHELQNLYYAIYGEEMEVNI